MRWATGLLVVALVGCGTKSNGGVGSSSAAAVLPSTSAPSASASASPPLPPLEPFAIARDPLGTDRAKHDVEYLASPELGGRDTGSEGARLASEYIAKRFHEVGLVPFGDAGDPDHTGAPPDAHDYFFRYSPFPNTQVDPPVLEIVPADDSADAGPKGPHAIPVLSLRTADGAATGDVTADAVFVGYGIDETAWDDYANADVTGKVVVMMRGAPQIPLHTKDEIYELSTFRSKIKTAAKHHAVALVVVSATDALPPAPIDPKDAGLPAIVVTRSASRGLFPAVGLDEGLAWNINRPEPAKAIAGERVHVTTHVASLGKYSRDVVGLLPAEAGSPKKGEYVVLGAHYDHIGMGGDARSMAPGVHAIHPGADDNASGTSLVMEVARRLASLPRRPARNIVFITFSGEELGLLGSHAWVDNPPIAMSAVDAMVNADMVGRLRNAQLFLQGTKPIPAWGAIFEAADEGLDLKLDTGSPGEDLSDRSDQASFREAHVPIAFLFTGLHPDYHRPSDTADKVNADGIEDIATLTSRVVLQIAERGLVPPTPPGGSLQPPPPPPPILPKGG